MTEASGFDARDVAILRAALDEAWRRMPREHRTPEIAHVMASAIARFARRGERDLVRLSTEALKAVVLSARSGAS